ARQLLSLIVSRLQFDNKRDKQVEELQEGYLFFQQKLGVGQRRVRQCLLELKDSGLIDFYSTTLIIRNMRCPHIQCIKLLKNFVSSRKTNYHSNQQEFLKQSETNHNSIGQNIQPNPQKISGQPEINCTSTEKIEKNFSPLNIIDNNISIFISRYGKKKFFEGNCGQNCGQSLEESKSTEEQSLQSEATVSSVSKILPINSSDDCGENKKNCEQNWVEGKSTQEQNFQSEGAVSSVSKIPPINSSESSPISDSGSESDSDSKNDDAGSGGVNQQSCQKLAGVISKIASKVKGWGLPQKLEEFHPLTEDDGDVLRMRSGRDFNLSFINKLLRRLSEQRPNNYFRNKQAVLSYMTLALMHEMRQPALANNESFNFKMDDTTRTRENYLQKVEASLDTSPTNQLKYKIAVVFERDTAYKLLTSCSFLGVFGDAYRIKLTQDISLLEHEKSKLFNQVQAVYGNKVQHLEIIKKQTTTTTDKSKSSYLGLSQLNPQSVWYKVRQYLLESYGEFVDKAWFSQLEVVEEDMSCKKIILKPATAFIGDYIKQKYGMDLRHAFNSHNFTFEFMKVDNGAMAI
ncbi:MAG: hypothetical protein LBE72_00530, partial [Rickettsia sp.]|nr:hypothetical protein [Rickettsia sp.]